ncbi:hypothetical protein UMM65_02445 [Aureibaculum sp. 2210JD6-5]|uniref:hypothetical protein n=1 Tax=Aureibaculum sp. 2210JD6-5 TaxID=3103957 RepID=UPI002AAE7216|nr:hypothetical protein [Aureibaculum sp. 2210JD6-5]MDY7394084.1 hypothetical protein [Aureibaculum sp. 2210JD6-5]
MKNSIIYIAGSDGSGKTTILKEVEDRIIAQGHKTRHIWLRSPKIISKPLMAYCRLVGLTKRYTTDGVKYSKHEFYRSAFVSWIFPILQVIDFKIKWYFEKRKIKDNEIILFDRFSLDTLADLIVDTRKMNLHKTWIGKEFVKALPERTKMVILKVDENVIRERKKDTLHDELLKYKVDVYNLLSKDLNIKVIDNNNDYKTTLKDTFKFILNEEN